MGKTSASVKDRYNAKAYDQIGLRVKKGGKQLIDEYAKSNGMSVNGFINSLIADKIDNFKL